MLLRLLLLLWTNNRLLDGVRVKNTPKGCDLVANGFEWSDK